MTTIVLPNAIFLHIPKTAGTSISKWIRSHVNDQHDAIYFDHPLLSRVYNDVGKDTTRFVFTCVRNPWSRTLSGYQNLIRHINENRNDLMKDHISEVLDLHGKTPTFNEWVSLLHLTTANVGPDWNMSTPQTQWIFPKVDYVIKLENLEQDFQIIRDMFKNDKPLSVLNKSELTLDYRAVYSDDSKKIVAKLFESDIDTWHYTF